MAIEYLDDLAAEVNDAGIGKLNYVEPGVWEGPLDPTRIVFHDETSQFINHGDSSYTTTKVFGVVGERCETLAKSNRESVTAHPFSSLDGDTVCTQVIFSGAGLTSQMAPESTDNIKNSLVPVNKSGVSDHDTLLSAYQQLDRVLAEKGVSRPIIIVRDGHTSRFDENVLSFLQQASLRLFILHPDTSGGTQTHDQMNGRLHSLYDEKKAELYTTISTLNRESFMNILSAAWDECSDPELLRNAARRVGLIATGFNINWMNQEMFDRAENLRGSTSTPSKQNAKVVISSPVGVQKKSLPWYEHKLNESLSTMDNLQNTSVLLEDVEGLLPVKKIQPAKTKMVRISQEHGSMTVKDMLTKVQERNEREREKEEVKQAKRMRRESLKEIFLRCKSSCVCHQVPCEAVLLKKCPSCRNVLKSVCSKSHCLVDGKKPDMVLPAAAMKKSIAKRLYSLVPSTSKDVEDDEDDEEDDIYDDESGDDIFSEPRDVVKEAWRSLSPPVSEESLLGKWYAVIFKGKKKPMYVGKVKKRFLEDKDEPVTHIELVCLKPKVG